MRSHNFIGIIIILIGLSILLHFPVFNFLFALFVIWIGVRIMNGHNHKYGDFWHEVKAASGEDYLRRVLVFSGIRTKLDTESFEGMEVVAIFGGGEIDASAVKTKRKDLDIELIAIFGGLKLKIPKGWAVKSEGVGIVGGFDNKSSSSSKPEVTVHLKGVAIIGGVEVVN